MSIQAIQIVYGIVIRSKDLKKQAKGLNIYSLSDDIEEDYVENAKERMPKKKGKSYQILGIGIGTYTDHRCYNMEHLDFDKVIKAKEIFDEKCPKTLLTLGGKPTLHFAVDDCSCCN